LRGGEIEMQLRKRERAPRRLARTIADTVSDHSRAAKTTAAGLVAAAAGVAAVRFVRHRGNGAVFHVRADGDQGWVVTRDPDDAPLERFDAKRRAITAGREAAKESRPSVLMIHGIDGKVGRKHVYAAH
jgi:hypothetical protein